MENKAVFDEKPCISDGFPMKFNVGDRVRTTQPLSVIRAGMTGKVVEVLPDGRYEVQLDDVPDLRCFYHAEALELLERGACTEYLVRLKDLLNETETVVKEIKTAIKSLK